jgi:replicative DNA helicase
MSEMGEELREVRRQARVGYEVPSAADAEKAVLSSVLQSPAVLDDLNWLTEEHFHFPQNRGIWSVLRLMQNLHEPIDLVTVTQRLTDAGELERCGGALYVTDLLMFVPTSKNVEYYAGILADKRARRKVMQIADELKAKALDGEKGPEQFLEEAEGSLLAVRMESFTTEPAKHVREGLMQSLNQLEAAFQNRGKPTGLASGLVDLDRTTGGLTGGQLVILAARPAQGKTTLMLQMAKAFSDQVPVLIFSMEMTMVELASKLMCSESKIDLNRVRDGFLSRSDLPLIHADINRLAQKPIWIDETPGLSCFELRSRARRAVVQHGIGCVFVDYLQLMRSTSRRAQESRAIEVAEISMTLKAIAKELRIPVVACAQLNRDAEQRKGPPKLADLRESGQIEQDADIVAALHRPDKDNEDEAIRRQAQLVLLKHRNGAVETINLNFLGQFARFENVTEKLYSNNPEKRQK